ncbi:MAG: hypothetical protein ACXVBW_00760, partial [Bdellovibrionota bacterium]
MKKIRSRWVVLLALAFSLSAHAEGGGNDQKSTVHLGIGGGFNYTNGFGEDTSKGVPVEPVGFSFNGALTLTLFQDYPFGFQIAADYMNINTSETPYRFSSNLLSASVIPRVSFSTWQIFRHSIGLGYTFGWNVGMNSATGTSAPSVIMNGGVLDLK